MAKAKSKNAPAHETKLLKAKEAVEEAKIVLHNAKIDFAEAKKGFFAAAKAHSRSVIERLTK